MKPTYLDHAAATPMDSQVLAAMQPYFTAQFYNPSALYMAAHDVSASLEAARQTAAGCLGVRPVEVVFTAGGTEANNLAIAGVLQIFADANVVVSAVEHDSVLEPARHFEHRICPVSEQGVVNAAALRERIDDRTVLVSIMYANNEIGTIQPIREIAGLLSEIRAERKQQGNTLPLYFHTDAAQAANYLDLHADRLGVDMMTLNGGKIYGPKQSGLLYVRAGVRLSPIILGGGQERGLRSGTENVAAAVGFSEALRLTQEQRGSETRRLQALQQDFIKQVLSLDSSIRLNGSTKKRLPNNVHVTIPGQDNERLVMALDEQGIMAAAGSACSASKDAASHVLLAIGMSEQEARSSLRLTMGRSTTGADINRAVRALAGILSR